MTAGNQKIKNRRKDRGLTRRSFLKSLTGCSLGFATSPPGRMFAVRWSDKYDFRSIHDVILAAVESHKATGIAVAVAHHGRIVWEEGFGSANLKTKTKVSEHTPFCLASITKPFTTTAMMTLVEAGKISLDDSSNKYLSTSSRLKGAAEGATIRVLGAHAAGLPSMFEMFPTTSNAQPSPEELLRNYGTLAYFPNEVYEYSNIGFVGLGVIASNVAGLEFGEFLTRQVLRPLALNDSFFDSDKARLKNAAVLYDELERPIPEYFTATPPSGELYVSAHDLARFALFNLKNHLPDQAPILSDHFIDELHRPVFRGPSVGASTFGWFSGQTKSGLRVIFKDGGQPGVSTIMYLVPEENLACVALANRSDNGEFLQTLIDQMAGTILPNWSTPNTTVGLPLADFPVDSVYQGRWTGKLHGGNIETKMSLEITTSGGAVFSLGKSKPEPITDLRLQGTALVGETAGTIESDDAVHNRATSLLLKLLRRDDKLVGRILASSSSPGHLAVLPYVIQLGLSS